MMDFKRKQNIKTDHLVWSNKKDIINNNKNKNINNIFIQKRYILFFKSFLSYIDDYMYVLYF